MTQASFSQRASAFLVDGLIAALLFAALLFVIPAAGGYLAALYLVFRDGLGGRSIGKRLFSLRVVSRDGDAGIGFVTSLRRNIMFIIPLLSAATSIAVFEGVILYFDEDGLRFGDRIAGTRVIRS